MPARQAIILFAYFIAVHALIVGWARYSAPIVPVAVILAAGLLESRVRLAFFQRLL